MGLKELHPCWPEFDLKSKHYICLYQIDGKGSLPLYGNKYITNAHYFNGNLARCWQKQRDGSTAKEVGETPEQKGIWCLSKGDRRIKLTVEYIDPLEISPVPLDSTSINHEAECSERSKKFLAFLLQKLSLEPEIKARPL